MLESVTELLFLELFLELFKELFSAGLFLEILLFEELLSAVLFLELLAELSTEVCAELFPELEIVEEAVREGIWKKRKKNSFNEKKTGKKRIHENKEKIAWNISRKRDKKQTWRLSLQYQNFFSFK